MDFASGKKHAFSYFSRSASSGSKTNSNSFGSIGIYDNRKKGLRFNESRKWKKTRPLKAGLYFVL